MGVGEEMDSTFTVAMEDWRIVGGVCGTVGVRNCDCCCEGDNLCGEGVETRGQRQTDEDDEIISPVGVDGGYDQTAGSVGWGGWKLKYSVGERGGGYEGAVGENLELGNIVV